MNASLTAAAWSRLAVRHRIRERLAASERILLSADEIKSCSGREPRLMTKFDTRESRPRLLSDATVLPVTNGRYLVLRGDGYRDLEGPRNTKRWPLPRIATELRTLPWSTGPASEAQALDMAHASGILADFLEDSPVSLTIRGRRRAPRFEFDFRSSRGTEHVDVEGVQVEVDSGLEGRAIHLVEAKLGARENFHVRQLYYPLRMWMHLVPSKHVTAVFLSWTNRRFALRRYSFDPVTQYHAMQLVSAVDYLLDQEEELPSISTLLNSTPQERPPNSVPFPQADDLRRVIDVVDAVAKGISSKDEISKLYDFNERQADYYGNAAAFLGLLQRDRGGFKPSAAGHEFLASTLARRNRMLCQRIAAMPVFRQALESCLQDGRVPGVTRIAEWITAGVGVSGETVRRRAQTVVAWARWVGSVLPGG